MPGTFDPVATYGTPTFDDPMTGENINDWVNPETGLLPNTNYIKITETGAKFYVTGKLAGFSTWYFTWHELTDFYLQSTFDSGRLHRQRCLWIDHPWTRNTWQVYLMDTWWHSRAMVSTMSSAWMAPIHTPYKDLVVWTKSDYILAGANKENVMGIKAIGNTLTIYANGHQIAEIFDSMYDFGRYGVFVSPELTENYTYRVVHMSYWDLTP